MSILSAMQYPHWLMVAGAVLVALGVGTSRVGDTIDYVATDTWGNTSTSTRTIIIEAVSSFPPIKSGSRRRTFSICVRPTRLKLVLATPFSTLTNILACCDEPSRALE